MSVNNSQQRRQFALFVFMSGVAAIVNFGSRFLFSHWMSFGPAIVAAYLCGMATAFALNRLFVFREATNALHHQAMWFTIVNLVALIQTLAVSLLLADYIFPKIQFHWHMESIAHAIGVAAPVVTSFIGHKRLSFRTNG
jgi:putative flippase GtrA